MADTKMNNQGNQGSMTNDRAKTETGSGRQPEQGSQFDRNKEKSAIGGGENRSQTGEQGRARDEIKQGQGQPTGQSQNRETETSGSTNR